MKGCEHEPSCGAVVRCGYLKKLKTSRRKFFVLRAESAEASARLEYYDSERKYSGGQVPPKRAIALKNCFNINRRLDTKHKHVIALYTKDDCFCLVLENDEEVDGWLKALLALQHGGEEAPDGEAPKPTFEHVWQVTVLNRGLGNAGLTGYYRLCLTDKTLSLIKRDCEVPQIELNLPNIRSCGNLKDFFFLEIGRSSTLGAGELWMQTEDYNIAQNVHSTVFHAMSTNNLKSGDELGPKSRNRSSSATEASKPTMGRKSTHMGGPPRTYMPSQVSGVASFCQHLIQRGAKAAERRHSISAGGVPTSGTISHQRTQSLPLANPAPYSDHTTTTSHPLRAAKRSNQSSKCVSGGRERCDSMPSRPRTTSEGNHPSVQIWTQTRSHHIQYRPQSLYNRDISHSPPSGSPVSPPSVGCSTDSAGSSYSLADETDAGTELDAPHGRYSHSLTPDEAIAEEECPESPTANNYSNSPGYMPMTLHSSDDGYVPMSPRGRHHNNSPSVSMSSVTSGTPSTDMRFAEYPLEKVASYFAPGEDDDARPARAYSVGSRPESYKKYLEMIGAGDLRVRALSVGSKTKKAPSRVLPPHGYHVPHSSAKSSSAPLLSNARIGGQGSHSSIGPMDDLMEMDFSGSGGNINAASENSYMDMRPGGNPPNRGYVEMKPGANRVQDTSPYVDMSSGSSPATNHANDYMEMDHASKQNNNNTDYIDMSFKINNQLSPFGSPKTPDGYVEMSLGSTLSEEAARKRTNKKRQARSQPIAIQLPSGNAPKPPASSSSSPIYALMGRKFSTGTPPMHLPLETTSLPRQRSRKNSRRDSKDSSSSSVTTPSSSSTIFPLSLNSPCSPVRPHEVSSTIKVPSAVLNTVYKKQKTRTESDYTPMDFDCGKSAKNESNSADYVNYSPGVVSDYAPMNFSRVPLSQLRISDDSSFRPINEKSDEAEAEPPYEVLRTESGGRSSTSSELCSSSGSTVVGGSRPESVNSDRLHYARLDLEEGNRSPRTVRAEAGPSPQVEATLTYAAIDFVKSEGLKHNSSLASNAKVKH